MAAKMAPSDDAGPSAFEIKLGMTTGRHSPDCEPTTIVVNAETTVNWIFLQGAYVLSHVHGRDNAALQKDFDLYLLRPGRDDIVLNPSRVIADYQIKKNDELVLRHKTLPLPICVKLCEGEDRKIEVNSGFPLMDVVPNICKDIGIEEYKELSLALPTSGPGGNTMQYEWLDLGSSLNGQGIQQGDTVLLRKKFFILNDDIQEALEGNQILMDLLYQQTRELYTTENHVGSGSDNISNCAKLSSLLHHIEQKDENISDEESVCKVMPKLLQNNSEFYEKTVTAYYQERVGTLEELEAKKRFLKFFSDSQSIIVNYFPVKKPDSSDELVLTVDSAKVKVCKEGKHQVLKSLEGMSWRLRDLRDVKCTSEKEQHMKINILGSWHEFVTDHTTQIASYLMEAQALTKQRVAKGRMSVMVNRPSTDKLDLTQPGYFKEEEEEEEPKTLGPLAVPGMVPNISQEICEEEISEDIEDKDPSPESHKLEEVHEEIPPNEPLSPKSENETPTDPTVPASEPIVIPPGDEEPKVDDEQPGKTEEFELEDITEAMDQLPPDDKASTESSSDQATAIDPPAIIETTTVIDSEGNVVKNSSHARTPTKASRSSTCSHVHIPEFLGLDYREVLEDYRLFQIVVMKQDVRPVLLNINKPVQEVVNSLCGTFDIENPGSYYLWIPTGIQSIIEKYGGRPKRRAGKFLKHHHNKSDFAPRLDVSKTLKEQYNFSIKPFLLHLKRYQAEEGVDDSEEVDCGTEWPENENFDVARYRRFYQSWTGIVQGAYPIKRKGAIKLAALLTQVYFGDRESASIWPPRDYDAKAFLPEKHKNSFGICAEIEREHQLLSGKTTQECINDVIEGCEQLPTMKGVFFEVTIPVKSDIFVVIPWNKMESRWFGINKNGIFSMDKDSEEVQFTQELSDISKWSSAENNFKLTCREKAFNGYTFQAKEIMDILELFIQLTIKERRRQQGPRDNGSTPQSQTFTSEFSGLKDVPLDGPLNGALNGSPHKIPLNTEQSLITNLTYDL